MSLSLTFSLAARVLQRFVVIFEGEGTAAMVLALSGSRCYGWLLRPELLYRTYILSCIIDSCLLPSPPFYVIAFLRS
jgi:hypothetical protein